MESFRFEADVRQILDLVTHSLYSDREIFLRELVSNASDALDRARFEGTQRDDLRPVAGEPGIRISVDKDRAQIIIEDDGIGLTHEEAVKNLGTIAHSGTRSFLAAIKEKGQSAEGLIGRFGVGFYSSFMVAEQVEVETLSALPDSEPVRWVSEGGDAYRIEKGARIHRGTTVTLHLREDAHEFLDLYKLKSIVRKHSDFVAWPVLVGGERANQEQALWTRSPSEIKDEEYNDFYKHISGDWEEPLLRLHFQADAPLQFQAVLFIPKHRPWEMDRLDFKPGLKLFQKRVKVLDHAEHLLPRYLRFVRGVVDAPDVDLNVSRELLQQTPILRAIRAQLTKRLHKRLKELSNRDRAAFEAIWAEFGHIIKEGLAEDGDAREALVPLLRFKTTRSIDTSNAAQVVGEDGEAITPSEWRSLAEVKADFKNGQDALWYLTDADKERIANNPVLEGFKKRGWEVLLMDDPVDEWVVMHVRDLEGTELKSVSRGELPEDKDEDPVAKAARDQAEPLAGWMGGLLGEAVSSVRLSTRLTSSPSVLVDDEGGMSANLERILKAANQKVPSARRVLELNPEHALVKTLARLHGEGKEGLEPFARLLLDHAAIAEGRLEDPDGFVKRLSALMEKASANL